MHGMKYKEYAARFIAASGVKRERQLVDMEEKADIISLEKASNTSCCERPKSAQMEEESRRLITMLHWPLDELIREVNGDPNVVHSTDSKEATLLHYAAQEGRTDVIEFLLDVSGGDIDAKDIEGNTAAHWAVHWNQPGVLQALLDAGADMTILNKAEMAPIHLACDQNKAQMIEILASHADFDPNLVGEFGQRPIHFCAAKDCEDAARKLLQYKPKLCMRDNHGVFPIHCAATHAARNVLELLISEGEKCGYTREIVFRFKDKENNTPLHAAVNGGCESATKVCLDAGARPDVQQDDDSTPLHLACSQGALGIVKLLLNADTGLRTLQMRDVENMTPLHRAAMFDHVHVVEYLVDLGAQIDAVDKHSRTPLLLATSRGAWRTASFLIQRGASHSIKDDQNRNVIHVMVLSGGNINILGVEISQKEDMLHLINDTDNKGCTPMHYATRDGNIKSLQGLLELGATVKLKNKDKQSPLHFAARYGRFNSCKRLLDSEIGPNIINDTDGKGMTALHLASWNGHTKVIQLLMLRGALLHRDHEGRTPLHLAAMNGYVETMKVLLGTHAHLLDQANSIGESALNLAAREGQVKAAKYLLTAGACLFLNQNKQSVFDIVIEEKNQDVAMALVTHDRWHEVLTTYGGAGEGSCPVGLLIEHMPEVMMKVLDRCITVSGHDPVSVDFWINYDFRYLEPTASQRVEFTKRGFNVPHLPTLNAMVRNNQVELLSHPLCIEYLNSKWVAYGGPIHYGYMSIYVLFVAFFTYFIVSVDPTLVFHDGSVSHGNINGTSESRLESPGLFIAATYLLTYAALNIIKEFYQMFCQGFNYFTDVDNYAEWTLYVCTLTFIAPFYVETSSHFQWGSGSVAIFFAWFNLLMYQQRIDRIGIYTVMFCQIFKTIISVMLTFSVIIVAFGLAFYVLMSGEMNHAFRSPEIAILRVFSMMMGELDFISSFVKPYTDDDPATLHYTFQSFVFLIMLVILLPILLMNLLIGLAVGDIAAVQSDAKLKRLAMQVYLHTDYEPKLPTRILKYVTKDSITLRPNAVCPRAAALGCFDKIKEKYILRSEGKRRFASLAKLNSEDKRCTGLEKMKQKMKNLSRKMDKQYDLLRLIVQKMDIHSEADEQDEGEAPPGDEGARMRLNMSQVVSAALVTFRAGRLGKDKKGPSLSIPRPASPTSDTSSVAEPSM